MAPWKAQGPLQTQQGPCLCSQHGRSEGGAAARRAPCNRLSLRLGCLPGHLMTSRGPSCGVSSGSELLLGSGKWAPEASCYTHTGQGPGQPA